jgi:hypothetical protein
MFLPEAICESINSGLKPMHIGIESIQQCVHATAIAYGGLLLN